MEEKYKGGLHEVEGESKKKQTIAVCTYNCNLKIDIPGKTFTQIKKRVERATYLPKICFKITKQNGRTPTITLALIKLSHHVPTKSFLQYELDNYCNKYAKKIKPKVAFCARIKNYNEREGCFEILWDIAVYIADRIPDTIIDNTIGLIMASFYIYIKKKLKNKLNCTIEGNCDKKNDK